MTLRQECAEKLCTLGTGRRNIRGHCAILSISRSAFPHSHLCAVEPPAWWEAWLPLHKMSDQEWEEYQEAKAEAFRQRCVFPLLFEAASYNSCSYLLHFRHATGVSAGGVSTAGH